MASLSRCTTFWSACFSLLIVSPCLGQAPTLEKLLQEVKSSEAEIKAEQKILAILDKTDKVNFDSIGIEEAIESFCNKHRLKFAFDEKILKDINADLQEVLIDIKPPLNLHHPGARIRNLLTWMLRPYGWTWVIRDGVILITSGEIASKLLVVRTYPIGELVPTDRRQNPDFDSLLALVKKNVVPQTWGGDEKSPVLDVDKSAKLLVIKQSHYGQEKVADFLSALRKCQKPEFDLQASPSIKCNVSEQEAGDEQKILQALNTRFDVAEQTTLEDAFSSLSKRLKIGIILDEKGMQDCGINLKAPVTLKKGTSVREFLDSGLKDHVLDWRLRDQAVLIICYETDCGHSKRLYPIADFLTGNNRMDPDALIQKFKDRLPKNWEENGGEGEIEFLKSYNGLLVSGLESRFGMFDDLLRELRMTRALDH